MKLSRTASYAVQATLQLAQNRQSQPVPCSRIAAQGEMPERFLLQILRSLVTSGVLRSTRGVEGGYALTRPPEEISLLEIIEAIEGPISSGTAFETPESDVSQVSLQAALKDIADTSRRQLGAIKLSQLLTAPPPKVSQTESVKSEPVSPSHEV
jgi:Rrf2 family protein